MQLLDLIELLRNYCAFLRDPFYSAPAPLLRFPGLSKSSRKYFPQAISDSHGLLELNGPPMTVGFLYGAGAETLIFVTGTSGK